MTEAGQPSLECAGLSVHYGAVQALRDVTLRVEPGEVVALLGPSGSGKSTLLHAAAGFVPPSAGSIAIAGREVSRPGWSLPPEKRAIGLVFQSYALWPHLSALDTVAYPLRRRGSSRPEALKAAQGWLDRVGLGALGGRRPNELSGGEQQRVGLARALAGSPSLFLLDEPTANLDASLKGALQEEITRQQRSTGAGALYVTHDPAEAFAVADRVATLHAGRLVQVGRPAEVYAAPADRWVASLTGACSIVRGVRASSNGGSLCLELAGRQMTCRGRIVQAGGASGILRPEWVDLAEPGGLALDARVSAVRFQGSFTDYVLHWEGETPVLARQPGPPRYVAGAGLSWQPAEIVIVSED
jgi:ABC-type Fe3+/spermidine/putrescine transport system ATPase subunit